MVAALHARATKQFEDIAKRTRTDPTRTVFVLGSYRPKSSLRLLQTIRNDLRTRSGHLAFLESEMKLGVGLQDSFEVLAGLSSLILFVATRSGVRAGWQAELAYLCAKADHFCPRIAFFAEGQSWLPGPVKDLLSVNPIRQGYRVRSERVRSTSRYVEQMVNSYFLKIGGAELA